MTALAEGRPASTERASTKRSSTLRRWPTWPLLTPAVAVISVLFLFPVIRLLVISLQQGGVSTYHEILSSPLYRQILVRTSALSAITTLVCVVIAVPVALRIRTLRPSVRGYLNLLFLSPLLVNSVVRALGAIAILGPTSGLQNYMHHLGISHPLIYSNTGVVIGLVDIFLGYMIVAVETGLLAIDTRLEDAARNLGAGEFRVLGRIVLPLILPNLIAGMTLVFVLSASAYVTPTLLGGTSSQLAAPTVYSLAVVSLDNERASALVVILIVLIAIVAALLSWLGLAPLRRWRAAALSPVQGRSSTRRSRTSLATLAPATSAASENTGGESE